MQEEVTQKTIALVIKTAKLDANVLKAAMRMYLNHRRQKAQKMHGLSLIHIQMCIRDRNRTTGLSELNAWRNSLKEMYITLNDSDIPKDAGVAIEYNIPQTSKRIDFLISWYGLNGKGNVVIIELKQWEKLTAIDGQDAIVETYTGGANRRVVHPCYQAWSYAALIRDYNEYVQDNEIGLHPCAYLHNYPRIENDPLDKEQYQDIMEETPAFTQMCIRDRIMIRLLCWEREVLQNYRRKKTGDMLWK